MRDARSEVHGFTLAVLVAFVVAGASTVFLPLFRCSEFDLHMFAISADLVVPGKPISSSPTPCVRCGDRGRYSLFEEWRIRAED